jgi:hypothetical protein
MVFQTYELSYGETVLFTPAVQLAGLKILTVCNWIGSRSQTDDRLPLCSILGSHNPRDGDQDQDRSCLHPGLLNSALCHCLMCHRATGSRCRCCPVWVPGDGIYLRTLDNPVELLAMGVADSPSTQVPLTTCKVLAWQQGSAA